MSGLSGWCAPAWGLPHTRRQHVACRSAVCGCEEFGGHVRNAQRPLVDSDSRTTSVELDAQKWDTEDLQQSDPARCVNTICAGPRRSGLEID